VAVSQFNTEHSRCTQHLLVEAKERKVERVRHELFVVQIASQNERKVKVFRDRGVPLFQVDSLRGRYLVDEQYLGGGWVLRAGILVADWVRLSQQPAIGFHRLEDRSQ
jgi:hypothetical protein